MLFKRGNLFSEMGSLISEKKKKKNYSKYFNKTNSSNTNNREELKSKGDIIFTCCSYIHGRKV